MLEKAINEITEPDLLALIEHEVSEKRSLEYKRDLPTNSHDDKKEFLADVSAFANAAGGHMVIGMREEKGTPVELVGVACEDPDAEINRLENILRDNIDPPLQGVEIGKVLLKSGRFAFVIRIPLSWSRPHAVSFRHHWRFYSRHSAGKYPLAVSDVRSAFLQSETLAEKIRHFRGERLAAILTEQLPTRLVPGARVVLHLIPFGAFEPATSFSLINVTNDLELVKPINGYATASRYNIDGFLVRNGDRDSVSKGYTQIYRDGIIEVVDCSLLSGEKVIPSWLFEAELIESVRGYLGALRKMTVSPPIMVLLSLVGVLNYELAVSRTLWQIQGQQIDRDTLILGEVTLSDFRYDVASALRFPFDTLWNAAGWPRSFTYDENGEWNQGPNRGQ